MTELRQVLAKLFYSVAGLDPSPENLALGWTAFRVASMRYGHVGFRFQLASPLHIDPATVVRQA